MNQCLLNAFAGFSLLAAQVCYADHISWNTDAALFAGNGCKKGVDSFAVANGDDLAVVFTNLGVTLPGGTPKLTDMKNCRMIIPAQLETGSFIGQITQSITYGVTKTENALGRFRMDASFFGIPMQSQTAENGFGMRLNKPLLELRRIDRFRKDDTWGQRWCHPGRTRRGSLNANLSVFGQKRDANEDMIMAVDGLDLKIEMKSEVAECIPHNPNDDHHGGGGHGGGPHGPDGDRGGNDGRTPQNSGRGPR